MVAASVAVGYVMMKAYHSATPEEYFFIFKSVSAISNLVGAQITYFLTVTNFGPDTATGVVIFSQLPAGMDFTSATNGTFTNGAVTFSLPDLASGAGTNYSVVLTPNNVGLLTNVTTISSGVFDPVLANNTARSVVSAQVLQVLDLQATVVTPMVLNRQTGLMEQTLLLTNAGNVAVSGARVFLCGMPSNSVYNASGYATNGCAYVDYLSPLLPGNGILLQMQYYLRQPVADPQLSVEALQPPAPPVVDRVVVQPGGGVLIEFTAIPGRTYTVQYSDDQLKTWQTAVPSLTAAGNRVQWIDNGPPKTTPHPGTLKSRLYRVRLSNN